MEIHAGSSLSAGLQVASTSGKRLGLDGKAFFICEACYTKFLWNPKPQISKLYSFLMPQDLSHVSREFSMSVWKFSCDSVILDLVAVKSKVYFHVGLL